jgi:hypothetical protein
MTEQHIDDNDVIETRLGFDSGDVQCLGCGRTITLWFNGGELDRETCCGYTYATEAVDYQLVITGPPAPTAETQADR